MKRLLRDSWTTDLPGQPSAETAQMTAAGASDDAAEGIAAFAAKRPSAFRGRCALPLWARSADGSGPGCSPSRRAPSDQAGMLAQPPGI